MGSSRGRFSPFSTPASAEPAWAGLPKGSGCSRWSGCGIWGRRDGSRRGEGFRRPARIEVAAGGELRSSRRRRIVSRVEARRRRPVGGAEPHGPTDTGIVGFRRAGRTSSCSTSRAVRAGPSPRRPTCRLAAVRRRSPPAARGSWLSRRWKDSTLRGASRASVLRRVEGTGETWRCGRRAGSGSRSSRSARR